MDKCLFADLTGREQEELAKVSSQRTLRLQFNRMLFYYRLTG